MNQEYYKTYYEANKERLKAKQAQWEKNNSLRRKQTSKEYREKNKEKVKEQQHQNYLANKVKRNAASKKYREENKEKIKQWRQDNKDRRRQYCNEYNKKRKSTDDLYAMITKVRLLVIHSFKRIGQNKPHDTRKLLGCTWEEAKIHFESLFKEGMTWQNHGTDGWHIDHIRPISSFSLEEMHLANHISNLQPLWATENLAKGDFFEEV